MTGWRIDADVACRTQSLYVPDVEADVGCVRLMNDCSTGVFDDLLCGPDLIRLSAFAAWRAAHDETVADLIDFLDVVEARIAGEKENDLAAGGAGEAAGGVDDGGVVNFAAMARSASSLAPACTRRSLKSRSNTDHAVDFTVVCGSIEPSRPVAPAKVDIPSLRVPLCRMISSAS